MPQIPAQGHDEGPARAWNRGNPHDIGIYCALGLVLEGGRPDLNDV